MKIQEPNIKNGRFTWGEITGLVEPIRPMLYKLALNSFGGRREQADDFIQDLYLHFYEGGMDSYDSIQPFASFATHIARRRIIDILRKRGRRQGVTEAVPVIGIDVSTDISTGPVTPQIEAHDSHKRGLDRVRSLLPKLSQGQREVIAKVYFEGRTYEIAAAQLRIPIGTLKSRMYRATQYLKGRLR